MSLANLSVAYTNMRNALESVCWQFGTWKEIEHIEYCRWCSWSKEWIEKNGHGDKCPIRGGAGNG